MEKLALIATHKSWNEEKARYEPKRSFDMTKEPKFEFGGIQIAIEKQTPYVDPLDTSMPLVLRKQDSLSKKLYVFEQRTGDKKPEEHIVGETIMEDSTFFSFSHLTDLDFIQIYEGDPKEHPDMVEIAPARRVGENGSSPLL